MNITSIIEREKGAGFVVWYEKDGAAPVPFDLPDGYKSPRADELRAAIASSGLKAQSFKDYTAAIKSEAEQQTQTAQTAIIDGVNKELDAIGAELKIDSADDVDAARDYIRYKRAVGFEARFAPKKEAKEDSK